MVPIRALKDGQIINVQTGELFDDITKICTEHKAAQRALAFGFLLYNRKSPQIYEILGNSNYWKALDVTSGKYLSLFYLTQEEDYFGQDLLESDGIERRNLHGIKSNDKLIPILKNTLGLIEQINLPAVLFFQEHEGYLIDYFLLELDQHKIEESFWELQIYIQRGVDQLEAVTRENRSNSKEIFDLLKTGVKAEKMRRKIFHMTQKFPLQLFLGWLTSKV